MTTRRAFRPRILAAALFLTPLTACDAPALDDALETSRAAASPSVASARLPVQVGTNVRVSVPDPEVNEFEALAAADPADPNNLLACTMGMDPRNNAHVSYFYSSFDGGESWKRTWVADRSSFVGDPTCIYGLGDTAYAAVLPIYIRPDNSGEIQVLRSEDKGRTWKVVHTRPFIDREYLTMDRTDGPYRGRLYMYANGERTDTKGERLGPRLELLYSVDGGESFTVPIAPPGIEKYSVMIPGTGAVLPDGTLIVPFAATRDGNDYIEVTPSRDGGASLAPPVVVSARKGCGEFGLGFDLAVDESAGPFAGRVYVVFDDETGGRCQIKLAHSIDGGRSWSEPIPVSDGRRRPPPGVGPDNFMPSVVVNPSGVVGVSWNDRRESEDNLGFTLRFAASLDGGISFLPSVRVSTAANEHSDDERLFMSAFAGGGASRSKGRRGDGIWTMVYPEGHGDPGHTQELVASPDGAFHPFWYDNRDGLSKLWTAKVTVDGRAVRNGSPDLAELADVSERVTFDYANNRFDPTTHTLTMDAILVNMSDQPLMAPVKARVTGLYSIVGTPRVTNAANGMDGVGAVWDFTGAVEGGVLAPGASTRPTTLAFRFDDFRHQGRREGDVAFHESMFLWLATRVMAQGEVVAAGR